LHKDIIVNHQKANSGCKTDKEYDVQYYQEHQEEIKARAKEYYEENKEHIAHDQKIWNENNKEKMQEYFKSYHLKNKEQRNESQRIRNLDNKDKKADYDEEYRAKNKARIHERITRKFTCECGIELSVCNRNAHNKSQKHIKFIEQKNAIVHEDVL